MELVVNLHLLAYEQQCLTHLQKQDLCLLFVPDSSQEDLLASWVMEVSRETFAVE